MTATHLRADFSFDLSHQDWLRFWFPVTSFRTVSMVTWTMSLDLLCKMANFTHLASFSFVSKCVSDAAGMGQKLSDSKSYE